MRLLSTGGRTLAAWEENDTTTNIIFVVISISLVAMSGLMSGLTLGLMSLDLVDMEVLKRSGTPEEQKYAQAIVPVIKNPHFLLVTLLLCNACAMEALPIFLDRLASPVAAIVISVTAVLFIGEIIPQSICTRYGLAIGAYSASFVRFLMMLTSPLSWPLGKLLDAVLGHEAHVLFRRKQLKALVDIHGEGLGVSLGDKLTEEEVKIITGALDLTSKIAYRGMTHLDNVFMLSSSQKLDLPTLRSVLDSGHSRIPVYREGNRSDIVGLILVKELLQYQMSKEVPVRMLKMRSLPRMPATTPMYDMLRLFQTGRSHMAILTQPDPAALIAALNQDLSGRHANPSNPGLSMLRSPVLTPMQSMHGPIQSPLATSSGLFAPAQSAGDLTHAAGSPSASRADTLACDVDDSVHAEVASNTASADSQSQAQNVPNSSPDNFPTAQAADAGSLASASAQSQEPAQGRVLADEFGRGGKPIPHNLPEDRDQPSELMISLHADPRLSQPSFAASYSTYSDNSLSSLAAREGKLERHSEYNSQAADSKKHPEFPGFALPSDGTVHKDPNGSSSQDPPVHSQPDVYASPSRNSQSQPVTHNHGEVQAHEPQDNQLLFIAPPAAHTPTTPSGNTSTPEHIVGETGPRHASRFKPQPIVTANTPKHPASAHQPQGLVHDMVGDTLIGREQNHSNSHPQLFANPQPPQQVSSDIVPTEQDAVQQPQPESSAQQVYKSDSAQSSWRHSAFANAAAMFADEPNSQPQVTAEASNHSTNSQSNPMSPRSPHPEQNRMPPLSPRNSRRRLTARSNTRHQPKVGEPIGIITIEDVIEELIRNEIVDETDQYVDNERLVAVNQALLVQNLPESMRKLLAGRTQTLVGLKRAVSQKNVRSNAAMDPALVQPLLGDFWDNRHSA